MPVYPRTSSAARAAVLAAFTLATVVPRHVPGAALECPVALCDSAAAAATVLRDSAAAGQVYATDLLATDAAPLFLQGNTPQPLVPGFYRLHLAVAVAPFADPRIRDLELAVRVEGAQPAMQWTLSRFDLPGDDRFAEFALDFVVRVPGPLRFSLGWQVLDRGRAARLKAIRAPDAPAARLSAAAEADRDGGGEDLRLDTDERDGLVALDQARQIPVRLLVRPPCVERLGAVGILSVTADKLLYRPGERGVLRVTLLNAGPTAESATLRGTLTSELADARPLPNQAVSLAAGRETVVTVPFEAAALWGTAAEFTVEAGGRRHVRREYFSVHDNVWAVGIGHVGGAAAHTGLGQHRQLPAEMRRLRANILEIFFWAPDDWCKMTPPAPEWWSGQTSYHENDANLRELIQLLHAEGIKVTSYGKSVAGGPFGWETARRHPEWFLRTDSGAIRGFGDPEKLDRWNDPEFRRALDPKAGSLGWLQLFPDPRQEAVVDAGAEEIARSVAHYGWDGVRFDGHYTVTGDDALSAHNMRRLIDRVRTTAPATLFGFNYGYTPDYHGGVTAEMRQGLAGGGMYMNEGIRAWHYTNKRYAGWQHYAASELRAARQVQEAGGHYHCIYDLGGKDSDWERDYYKLVFGLVAGAHPTYGYGATPGAGREGWGAFMTRWSGMLWDPAAEPLTDAAALFRVAGDLRVWWQPFARRRVVSPQRAFYILHLLNPPPADEIAATQLPAAPAAAVRVGFRPPVGCRVERVGLVRPEDAAAPQFLDTHVAGGQWEVSVSAMQRWSMLVWEVSGVFEPRPVTVAPPPLPPRGPASAAAPVTVMADPLKRAESASPAAGDGARTIHAFDHGSCNLAVALTPDPEAQTGAAQWRPKTESSIHLGSWWIGPRTPGRYRIRFRVKWTDPNDPPAPQVLRFEIRDEIDDFQKAFKTLVLVTPGYPNPPAGAQTLGEKGRYSEYDVGEYEKQFATWFTVTGQASTPAVGEHTVYFDRMTFDLLERYDDRRVAGWGARFLKEKPAGLRQPQGAQPAKTLFVKGMFWQPYLAQAAYAGDTAYALPDSYEALYAYDTIVLCNRDFQETPFPVRKLYHDFVQDGGRLVLLGGMSTLGQGGIAHTFLDDILPVTCRGPFEVVRCEPPLVLGPDKGKPWPGAPALFWRHQATPRPGTAVLAWAGEEPVAVAGTVGKGRVVVFLGTTCGDPAPGTTPFWETPAWGELFRRMLAGP